MIVPSLARIIMTVVVTASIPSVGEVPLKFAPQFGCVASLPSPHPSGGFIKAHMRITCKRPVAKAHVEVQLWRLRAWGWEEIGTFKEYNNTGVRTADVAAVVTAARSDCYYYRSTGDGFIIDWNGRQIRTPGEGFSLDQRMLKGLPPGCGTKW
jgi:hypothetical protein